MVKLKSPALARTGATGFGTPAGRLIVVASWVLLAIGAVLIDQISFEAWIISPLAAGLVGGVLVTRPGASKLKPFGAAAVVVCAVVAGTVLFGMQLQHQMLWMYTYASYLLGALAGRGNLRASAIGAVIVWGTGIVWASQQGASVSGYLLVLSMPVFVVVVCIVWNRLLERIASRDLRHRDEAERARIAEAVAKRNEARSREELAVVRREAGSLLARIVAWEPVTDEFRLQLSVAEAGIRDRLRSPYLLHPTLETAILELRLRGGEVILLGEAPRVEPGAPEPNFVESTGGALGALMPSTEEAFTVGVEPEQIGDELARAVADWLRTLEANTTVTIRSMPAAVAAPDVAAHTAPHVEAALSLLVRNTLGSQQIRFSEDGTELSQK